MPSEIVRRIERELGFAGLVDALASQLPASDLRSLLIEVYKSRAAEVIQANIRAHAARDPLITPSAIGARDFLAFDSVAFQAAADFSAIDLSPVCPFGATSTLGHNSQNNVLTTIRNVEVLGDSTIALAIEAAGRRPGAEVVRLCASHRVIRLQPFDVPGYSPHFRLFSMVTAGRDKGSHRFEAEHLCEHIRVYLRMFQALSKIGYAFRNPIVEFADMAGIEAALAAAGVTHDEVRKNISAHKLGGTEQFLRNRGLAAALESKHSLLESAVIEPLRAEFPDAQFRVNQQRLEGFGYYSSFTLRISARAVDGNHYPVVDGGFTDWTARLLGNKKERLLISGIGTEFACKVYRGV